MSIPQSDHRLIVLTGTSGVGLAALGPRLIGELSDDTDVWRTLKFEDFVMSAAKNELDDLPPSPRLMDVFRNPETILLTIWKKAFEQASVKIDELLTSHNVVLCMHASWRSGGTSTTLSFVDPHDLVSWQTRADTVINLIDDIYDMHARLSRPGEKYGNSSSFERQVHSLIELIEWREIEYAATEIIARSLGASNSFLLAVKHPMKTLVDLIRQPSPRTVYLSHPITEIRRRNDWYGETKQNIDKVAAILRDQFVLFEPTTIDELRLSTDPSVGPRLSRRWSLPMNSDHSKCDLITEPESADATFLITTPGANPDVDAAQIRLLMERIDFHVNWRDRRLVNQSHALVVLRPFSKKTGEISGGVREEALLHQSLRAADPSRPKGLVWHPSEDEENRQIAAVQDVICQDLRQAENQTINPSDVTPKVVKECIETILAISAHNGEVDFRSVASPVIEILSKRLKTTVRLPVEFEDERNLRRPQQENRVSHDLYNLGSMLVQAAKGLGAEFDLQRPSRSTTCFSNSSFQVLQAGRYGFSSDSVGDALAVEFARTNSTSAQGPPSGRGG